MNVLVRLRPMSALLSCLACAVVPLLPAQPAASTNADPTDESVVRLSPFNVEAARDSGYRRFNTATATRVGVSIADTPLNIQVISREFLDDLAVDSLNAVFDYSAGVKSSYDFSILNTGNVRVRGMPTDVIYRDGFRKYANTHLDGVDRVEVVKGPASLFFGRAEPGGIINYTSKKPQFTEATTLQLTGGSHAYYKALLDHQGTVADNKLGYRIVTSKRDSDDWLQYTHWDETFFQGGLSFRPTNRFTFTVAYEYADQQRDGGPVPALVANLDYIADWEAGRLLPSQLMPGLPELYYEEWQPRQFRETGLFPSEYTGYWFPRGYNWNRNGSGSFENGKSRVFDAQILWTIVDRLDLRVAYSRQHADFETSWFINQDPHQSPNNFNNAAPTPTYVNYGFLVAPAWRTDEGFVVPGSQADVNKVDSFQADLTYSLEALGATHTFVVSGEYVNDRHRQYGFELNEEAFIAAGGVVGTFEDPGIPNWNFFPGAFGTMYRDVTDPNFVPPNFRSFITGRSNLVNPGSSSESIEKAVSGSYQGSYLDGRLRVLGGARYTEFATVPLDNNGRQLADPGWTKSSATTPTVGANFYVTPSTILYASYSKSFKAITTRNPTFVNTFNGETIGGDKLDNEEGEGMEFGVKVQALDNRLTGTFSIFRLDRSGVVLDDALTNARLEDETLAGTAQWVDAVTGSVADYNLRRNSGLHRVEGAEFDLIWTPSPNIQLLAGYSNFWTRDVLVDDPSVINVANGGLYDPELNDGRDFNWRTLAQVPEHLFSFWGKYSFTDGRFRGLSAGFGGNYESESPGDQSRNRGWIAGNFWKFDAMLAYQTEVFSRRTTFQLNVSNVFDRQYITGSFGLAPARIWRLSARVEF